jgi:mRNA interferase RelE/StbE
VEKSKYEVIITKFAFKKLSKLPENVKAELTERILALEDNPRPQGSTKLVNRDGYRIRWTDYRILYTIKHLVLTVTVIDAGHRKDIYE